MSEIKVPGATIVGVGEVRLALNKLAERRGLALLFERLPFDHLLPRFR